MTKYLLLASLLLFSTPCFSATLSGSGWTGTAQSPLDMANQPITNISTVAAGAFVGDGSQLTGLPSGTTDHSQLSNLDYESSGHTGFASTTSVGVIGSTVAKVQSEANAREIEITISSYCETGDPFISYTRSSYTIVNVRAYRKNADANIMTFDFKCLDTDVDLLNGALSIPSGQKYSNVVSSTRTVPMDCGIIATILSGRSDKPVSLNIIIRRLNGQGQ